MTLQEAVKGWAGTFHFEGGVLGYLADKCRKGECDCSLNECGFAIAKDLDDSVGASLAVLLNGPRVLLAKSHGTCDKCKRYSSHLHAVEDQLLCGGCSV